MKSKNFIKVSIWVLITILILSLGFNCLNAPSTTKAIFGFITIVAWISVSYESNKFETDVQSHLDSIMHNEHFYLRNVTSGLKYPPSLEQAIDLKNKVVQDELRAQNEVRLAEAQAKKLIVQAEADKQANELKTKALTPAILEQMWIEKWDGKLLVYGTTPTFFKDITK